MADSIYNGALPAATQQADGDPHHWGPKFTVTAGNCVGGAYRVPSTGVPDTAFWQLWDPAGPTLLAEVDLNSLPVPTPDTWMTFTSAEFTPAGDVALTPATTYYVCVFFQGGDGQFTDPGSFPVGTGVVSSTTGAFDNVSPQNTINETDYGAYFYADVLVEDAEATTGTLDWVFPAFQVELTGDSTLTGTLDMVFPGLQLDLSGENSSSATLDLVTPASQLDIVGLVAAGGTLDWIFPEFEFSFTGVSAAGGNIMGPCGWTIPDPLCCDTWDDLDPEVQSAARDYAATILWAATGRRFGPCEVQVRPCGMRPCGDGMLEFFGFSWSGGTWVPYIFNGNWYNCMCPGTCCCDPRCAVRLTGPVESIVEVTIGGIAVDPDTYRVDNQMWLVRTNGECWPTCADMDTDDGDNVFVVTYMRGDPVPNSLLRAAATLACEWGKACTGGECRLGNQVTSLARNGVTIEMLSPDDLLAGGLTGIFEVDQVIKAWNPYGLKQRDRILAPELRIPREVTFP